MRWLILVVALLGVAVAPGCLGSSFQGDCSDGHPVDGRCVQNHHENTWTGQKAAFQVESTKLPPGYDMRLHFVQCILGPDRLSAACTGTLPDQRRAALRISLDPNGGWKPQCPSVLCSPSSDTPRPDTTRDELANRQLEKMAIPPFNAPPLRHVACYVTGNHAICAGRDPAGRVVLQFTIRQDGSLTARCVSPEDPHPPPNIFCAM
jgi:hypothetical protein